MTEASTPLALLDCDFGFISDAAVRSVLQDYYDQAVKAQSAGSFLGAVVGCGAVAEGLLTWLLQNNAVPAKSARAARKQGGRAIEDWPLEVLVDVAEEIGVFDTQTWQLCEAVRNWRNLVHPYRRVRGSPRFDNALALSAFHAVARITEAAGGKSTTAPLSPAEMNFGWFIGREVAGCRGPAAVTDLEFLSQSGVKALVRLAKETVITHANVEAAGLIDCHVNVPDFHAPNPRQLQKVLQFMRRMVKDGKPVAVSCGAGYGRTGTVLACYLIEDGKTDTEALEYLQRVRPESHREVLENLNSGQLDAIRNFARSLGRAVAP